MAEVIDAVKLRVAAERDELLGRIQRLAHFINHDPRYQQLDAINAQLLTAQLQAMLTYHAILCTRLDLLV